jgi:uncharacterized protein YoxC
MDSWQVAILTLGALLVGMLVPVLFQLRSTLSEFRKELRAVGGRLGPTLDDARLSAERIRRMTDGIEGKEAELGALLTSAGGLASSLERIRGTTQIATAVAAAVAAGVRAFREVRHEEVATEVASAEAPAAPARPETGSPTNGKSLATTASEPQEELTS